MAQENELPIIAVEIATLRLALAALAGYLLVDDPDEANEAIDGLIARIDRMARTGITAEPLPETASDLREAARIGAIALFDSVRPGQKARQ